jgi:tight adherence protein C
MELVFAATLFLAVAGTVTWLGVRLWVRPRSAMDRVTNIAVEHREQAPVHPSLALREVLQKIGSVLPANPKDVSAAQKRLIRAGIRNENAVRLLYGARVLFAIVCPVVLLLVMGGSASDPANQTMALLGAAGFGFWVPNEYVKITAKRRQKAIRKGLPNALDLMVVCVESGLGLDQAILQVAKELQHAHPEVTEEFALVNLELKAGKRRYEALRNLTERTNVDELKKLVAVLIQADRFGTGIGQSLRGHADFMRVQARQVAEEKASKLGVKLVFPIFFCVLPSLFVVTVGPVGVRIVRELLPMMDGFTRG